MKPILFSTPMVQAILAGRKTQTRRVINPQPLRMNDEIPMPIRMEVFSQRLKKLSATGRTDIYTRGNLTGMIGPKSKYQQGDTLYVRETWRGIEQECGGFRYEYKATEQINLSDKWRPSLFMPKEIARIFLEVTEVRAERLQDITPEDAIKEGIQIDDIEFDFPVALFSKLWDSINAKKCPWDSNPWVWVYTFKIIEKP
jgi:hypothetical protein